MSFSYTVTQSVQSLAGQKSASKQYVAAASLEIDEQIAIAADVPVVMNLDVSQVKAFLIVSDQDVTAEFNSSGAPTPSIALKKDVPYIWTTDSYDTFKLTVDVTALFITNASAAIANVSIRAAYDPTI
jgi:hypothetical protein